MRWLQTFLVAGWVLVASVVLGLGGQVLLSQPHWVLYFPSPVLAFLTVLVVPVFLLTLSSSKWLLVGSNE